MAFPSLFPQYRGTNGEHAVSDARPATRYVLWYSGGSRTGRGGYYSREHFWMPHMGLMDATIHTHRRIRARQRLAKCPICLKSAERASLDLSHLRQTVSLLDVNEAVVDPEHGQVGRGGVTSASSSSSSGNRRSPLRRSWKYILTLKGRLTQSIFPPLT